MNTVKNTKRSLYIITAALLTSLFLAVVEYGAHWAGLELRTFAQVGKGLYLWLVMPLLVIFCLCSFLTGRLRDGAGGRERRAAVFRTAVGALTVIFCLLVLAAAFVRGVFYVFSGEMVTEKMMSDGYIQGIWSDFLSENQYTYYTPVAGIFRRPFLGWTQEQITEKVRERYNADAELVERQDGGMYVFRVPDALEDGGLIYFHVKNSYHTESNYFFQVLRSEAEHFWAGRGRTVTVSGETVATLTEAEDTGGALTDCRPFWRFRIACGNSAEDTAALAADLLDWLQFVEKTGQFPYETEQEAYTLLSEISVGSGEDFYFFDMFPLDAYLDGRPWNDRYGQMREKLEDAAGGYARRKRQWEENGVPGENDGGLPDNAADTDGAADFMDVYDGSYEKECAVGDGLIRYRMVVTDAALGSRFYALLKSTDGGAVWEMANPDPFDQQTGMGIDFTFLDEKFGFATLMHNGGDYADLYVTEDGGDNYRAVVLEPYTVTLEDGYTYTPYDYPQMPCEEDGVLCLLCGQGADGDYAGGDNAGMAFYRSADGGHTFQFVEIR